MERVDDNHKITQIPSPSSTFFISYKNMKNEQIAVSGFGKCERFTLSVDLLDAYASKLLAIAGVCLKVGYI